jgi:hypothetical protein
MKRTTPNLGLFLLVSATTFGQRHCMVAQAKTNMISRIQEFELQKSAPGDQFLLPDLPLPSDSETSANTTNPSHADRYNV